MYKKLIIICLIENYNPSSSSDNLLYLLAALGGAFSVLELLLDIVIKLTPPSGSLNSNMESLAIGADASRADSVDVEYGFSLYFGGEGDNK